MPGRNDSDSNSNSDADAGVTVITAAHRLARELRRQFDHRQLAAGKQAWESADVLPYNAWLRRTWRDLSVALERPPLLLSDLQLTAAWERIISADIHHAKRDTEPLWNTHASAKIAVDAWRMVDDWCIDLARCAGSAQEDHICWLRWAKQFEQQCAEQNWLDPHRLATRLIEILADGNVDVGTVLPAKVRFVGFDQPLPRQQLLVEALKKAGVAVKDVVEESVNQTVELHACEDEATQWLDAARWAREKLRAEPTAKIAIVAPDLNQSATAIEYALRQLLCPRQLVEPGTTAALPYHSSLGEKLSHYPVVDAALTALAPLAGRPLPLETVSRLLRSPFIRAADTEAAARGKLELWCRRYLTYQICFKRLVENLSGAGGRSGQSAPARPGPVCPLLLTTLSDALPLLEGLSQPHPARYWVQRFGEWLDQLGWPGERGLDSDEFQTAAAFRRQLRELAQLDLTAAPMSAAVALAWLRRRLNEQPFQVEAQDEPVHVLGISATAGQRFDGVWFGGLTEARWPPAQRPNPFIATAVQRKAGVFRAFVEGNRAHAEELQGRLIASAREVVLSWPKLTDDIKAERSPLLSKLDEILKTPESEPTEPPTFDTPANLIHAAKPKEETITDTRGPAMPPGAAAGGVSLIADQAKCPFRAFAIHRLHAHDAEPRVQGLAASERGALIHFALRLAWEKIRSSKNLRAMPDDELHATLADAATCAGKRYMTASGCGARFHETQTQWVADTLAEWFALERRRAAAFTAEALEAETTHDLSGLKLTFKTDRIDRMADGTVAVIDYKTGAPESLRNWAGSRPKSPQLPLYAVAMEEDTVAMVAYGRVRRGECGFAGVNRGEKFEGSASPAAVSPNRVHPLKSSSLRDDFANWDALLDHWHKVLPELAEEFLAGEARVDPHTPGVCDQCDLHSLCRIDTEPEAPESTP